MNKTNIAWTDFTWNPITGCTAVSDGCKNCYAKIVHERFYDTPFSEIVFHQDRLTEPNKRKKGAKIFIGSMTDIFQSAVPPEQLSSIFDIIHSNPQHTFIILTKRPQIMQDRMRWLYAHGYSKVENFWLGVTAENQEQANERIPTLLNTPAPKRFVSIEPMLSKIDLCHILPDKEEDCLHYIDATDGKKYQSGGYEVINKLDWVIVGGESGAKSKVRKMQPEWVEHIYETCKTTNTPFFFKQWGAFKSEGNYHFENVQEFPKNNKASIINL